MSAFKINQEFIINYIYKFKKILIYSFIYNKLIKNNE